MSDPRIAHWRADPVKFVREVLGQRLWSGQREIIRSLRKHKRVTVRSAFGQGKTHVAACAALWFYSCFPNSRVVTTANTWKQVENMLWALIGKLFHGARVPIGGVCNNVMLKRAPEWLAYGVSVDDPNALQGAHNPFQLIIFDEAQGIARPLWAAADSLVVGSNTRFLAIGNPLEPAGPFYETHRPNSGWHRIHLDCLDHPNIVSGREVIPGAVGTHWLEEKRAQWDADGLGTHPLWMSRVRGDFPPSGDSTMIPLAYLEMSADLVDPPAPTDGDHLGVDIARKGGDSNVAALLRKGRFVSFDAWNGMDGMETCGKIIALQTKYGIKDENVHLDNISYGAIVADRALELGHAWDRVDFGGAPEGDWQDVTADTPLLNRRAELFWVARELFRMKRLCLPRLPGKFEDAWADLTAPCYDFQSDSRIKVEPKDNVKKKIGRSPDCGDACLLSLSRTASCGLGITRF